LAAGAISPRQYVELFDAALERLLEDNGEGISGRG
jgi:hypothetical protein